jgi:peptidoglycan/xylan/chitin deacetylase (PgdA/CDA1 family)
LSWDRIAALEAAGVGFGSHTQTHQILTTVPLGTAREEVRESKAALESNLKRCCDLFAYPNGDWSPDTRRILAEEGFRLAFTNERGAWLAACDRFAIPRSNVYENNVAGLLGRFSPAMFEYTSFWKVWRATKRSLRREARTGLPAPASAEQNKSTAAESRLAGTA